jgi:hypothetical protein
MKGLELLKEHPHTANLIKKWFVSSMVNSLSGAELPDDFKNYMLEQGVDDEKLAILIDANPRMLFDVFDENKIYITISRGAKSFMFGWCDEDEFYLRDDPYSTRKECEMAAIVIAFGMLEKKLFPLED